MVVLMMVLMALSVLVFLVVRTVIEGSWAVFHGPGLRAIEWWGGVELGSSRCGAGGDLVRLSVFQGETGVGVRGGVAGAVERRASIDCSGLALWVWGCLLGPTVNTHFVGFLELALELCWFRHRWGIEAF